MTVTTHESEVDAPGPQRRFALMSRRTWPAWWPLAAIVVPFPLWWALGVSDMVPIAMAIPMAAQLLRRRPVRTPAGFPAWAVFLGCVLASGAMLWLDAPGAVPGGASTRPLVFGYRVAWYLACTVVLLWVTNLDESELPTRRVMRLFAWMFVVTTAGGLAGVLLPNLEFSSLLELVLPGALANNGFIRPLIHPSTASIQSVLGDASPRPIAPFAFSNSWGSNLSMYLPFFVVTWFGRDAGWRRGVAPVLLVLATVPVVFSLNRALWLSLALGLLFVLIRFALAGRPMVLGGLLAATTLAAVVFVSTPLADLATQRLENPHSNDRRGQLLSTTVASAATGSPVLGFGSTRDVQGSFASIAGGGTPECPACRVPPLGTQGQIWLVVFSQGLLGAAAFVGFFARQWNQHWRARTTAELVGAVVLVFFSVQLLVYDTLGMPMLTMMAAIGLMYRERRSLPWVTGPESTLAGFARTLRRHRRLLAATALVGALAGSAFAATRAPTWTATAAVLLEPAPVHLALDQERPPDEITIDTEASMVFSEQAVTATRAALGLDDDAPIRDRLQVTAPTNTRVLEIEVTGSDRAETEALARTLPEQYLLVRGDYLALRRAQVGSDLREQLRSGPGSLTDASGLPRARAEEELRSAIDALLVVPTSAGEVLRPVEARRAGSSPQQPLVSGAVLGAVAGVCSIWLRRRFGNGPASR